MTGDTWGTGPTELRFGYSLDDVQHLTRAALTADRSLSMDYRERWDIAWSAIIEELYAAPHWPRRESLVQAGWQAIYREVRCSRQTHGYRGRESDAGHGTAPRFAKYWFNPHPDSPETPIVEREATRQILPRLGMPYRDALLAVAAHDGDLAAAAATLGVEYGALTQRMRTARAVFTRHWFEGETPPGFGRGGRRGTEEVCGRGHARAEHSYVNGQGKRFCRACQRLRDASARRRRRGAVTS